jgi:putative phage-type endonuclease
MENLLTDIIELVSNTDTKPNYKNILIMANTINLKLSTKYNISYELILEILFKLLKPKFKLNNIQFDNKCFREHDILLCNPKIPSKFKKLEAHFQKLKALPQPEQRTKEWFDYRHNRITASDTAAAIDLNPYEPVESFILKKCDPDHKFLDNHNVYHGKKYEPIATLIYEHIYNIKVTEFGALPSETHDFLGASPDGICSSKTLDNKFSELLGRMLEIKCTVGRHIYTSGRIAGHICPFYYYCQVQQQLECCDLEQCDFWQCKIVEYNNRKDYLIDMCNDTRHTFGVNDEEYEIDNLIKKGIIIKFLPKQFTPEFVDDSIEWKSKFIYPPKLNMNEIEYDSWIINTLDNWQNQYKDIAETHYYEKLVYWKLEISHNVIIERDRKFMNNILPVLKETWNKVKYYRENLDKLNELKKIIDKRKKYIKFDTKISINNNLINEKKLFLSKTNTNINSESECDFID